MRTKVCQLSAEAVCVLCPSCGAPQPNHRDGSHLWAKEDFHAGTLGKHKCADCDADILIVSGMKAQFN